MRIFVSWSGEESRQIAAILRDWLPKVLQEAEVYVSAAEIQTGERWLANVNANLTDHNFGISVVTPSNLNAPWLLYEAGALAKSLDKARLVPLLCGVEAIDIPNHPLQMFQWAVAARETDMRKMVYMLNDHCDRPLPENRLSETFLKWYPDFRDAFAGVDLPGEQQANAQEIVLEPSLAPILNQIMRELRDLRQAVGKVDVPLSDREWTAFLGRPDSLLKSDREAVKAVLARLREHSGVVGLGDDRKSD
ncbi:TIR domain-containing protein [Rhizobium azibense]|uniref:TIR domain-containing protein n=1 Tax=Rhizobium azibense TaxID=1136135 RepID=A0A4R3RAC3_9HYPH|nr:TIR domain-containing protein [Rhizobium azibense]TCU32298.1 TIR domain-containing protein [Rhizobium azibense]